MPKQYCFLCASDEGIFLDITADNKQVFHEQFEICTLVKVLESDELPIKICHKCVYELNQCSSFVKRYKFVAIQRANADSKCCSLCLEPGKSEFIFDLSKDKHFQLITLDKIHKLFNDELPNSYMDHKLICLSCRYAVDVLLDLKNIYMETSDRLKTIVKEEIDYLTFPKINTTVVSRKTTVTASARINLSGKACNNFQKMTRTRSQSSKLSTNKLNVNIKSQVCVKCHNSIETGQVHKGQKARDVVCKKCWKNVDICTSDSESHMQNSVTETKLCTVFLKDVLKNVDDQEKSLYRIDEDDKGNKTYVITDQSLSDINKHNKLPNAAQHTARSRQSRKRPLKTVKSENGRIDDKDVPKKKQKSDKIESTDSDTPHAEKLKIVKTKDSARSRQGSDSDSSTKTSVKRSVRTLTRYKRATGSSLSDADVDNKRNRKKLSTILKGVSVLKTADAKDKPPMTDHVRTMRKRTRHASVSPIMEASYNKAQPPGEIRRKARSSQRRRKSGSAVNVSQESQSSEYDEKEVIFETKTYVCDECGASYENKLLGLTHKLRHYNQPKLKLQKLCGENLETEMESSGTVKNGNSENLSEAVAISLQNDKVNTEDESHSLGKTTHIKDDIGMESKMCSPKNEVVEDAVDVELVMKDFDDEFSQRIAEELEEDGETQTSIVKSAEEKATEITTCKSCQGRHKNNCNNEPDKSRDNFSENERMNGIEEQDLVKEKQEMDESDINKREKSDVIESKNEESACIVSNSTGENKNDRVCMEQEIEEVSNECSDTCGTNNEQKTASRAGTDSSNEANCNMIKNPETGEEVDKEFIEVDDVKATDSKCTNDNGVRETVEKLSDVNDAEKVGGELDDVDDVKEAGGELVDVDDVKRVAAELIDVDDVKKVGGELVDVSDVKETSKQEWSDRKQEITAIDGNTTLTDVNCTDSNQAEIAKHIMLPKEGSISDQSDSRVGDIESSEPDIDKHTQTACVPVNVAAKVLQEVLDLATAEVQKRRRPTDKNIENDDTIETETLENISREIQNTINIPKVDAIEREVDINLQ